MPPELGTLGRPGIRRAFLGKGWAMGEREGYTHASRSRGKGGELPCALLTSQSPPASLMGKPGPEFMVKGAWESELAAQTDREHGPRGCLSKQAGGQHSL